MEDLYPHIHRWIDHCNTHHEKCRPDMLQRSPDWVIDVANRCIVPGETVDAYVALSYVWEKDTASHPERNKLFQSNISILRQPGALEGGTDLYLPRIIKDAIKLVHGLGMNYLWVDCFCIVQDAPDIRAKVEQMDEVYSHAYFTIVAAVGQTLMDAISFSYSGPRDIDCTPENLYGCLQDSEWAQRGWTFQEAILSRRIVVFMDDHVFWDCPSCVWKKNEPESHTSDVSPNKRPTEYMDLCHRAREVNFFEPNFRTWFELICLYNQRNFTYPQDAMIAFSGIQRLLSEGFPKGFVGGLPLECLNVAMMWQPRTVATRRTSRPEAPSQYLPSWSCFGWQCPVDPYSLRSGLSGLTQMDKIDHAASWRTESLVNWSVFSQHSNDACKSLSDTLGPYLKCSTTHAFFDVSPLISYAERVGGSSHFSLSAPCMLKISILSLRCPEGTDCDVLWLSHKDIKVGLLRKMDSDPIEVGATIELIAISSGSATRADLDAAFEEKEDRKALKSRSWRQFERRLNRRHLSRKIAVAGCDRTVHIVEYGPRWWDEKYYDRTLSRSKDELIQFYNVLWIERQGDLAFRKAAGRVSKEAWDEYCSGHVEIILA